MRRTILFILFVLSGVTTYGQYDRLFQVTHLYPKGLYEVHVFNNLWTRTSAPDAQMDADKRESFFTTWGQYTYGLSDRVNVGLDFRFRSVITSEGSAGHIFDALKFQRGGTYNEDGVTGYRRVDLTNLGLRVKYQPFKFVPNFSIEHLLFVPLRDDLQSDEGTGFSDWQGGMIWNRIFIDQMIGSNFLLFWQFNFLMENVAVPFVKEEAYYQYGFPITAIGTYIINSKTFIYGLMEAAPIFGTDERAQTNSFVPYAQLGVGAKYFFKPWLQTEMIVTRFWDTTPHSEAWSLNLGVRFFGLTKKGRALYLDQK